MEQLLYRYNPWWEGPWRLENVKERPNLLADLKKNLSSDAIIFLTGLRRVGKTTLMKLLIEHLLREKKIDSMRIFYFSMDDYIAAKSSILEIVDEYRKIHRLSLKEKVYLFLDEIAFKEDFALQLKNMHDSQNVKIFASSSSASILKNKKSHLTGRHLITEVQPLDFEEYLQFKGIALSKADQHLAGKYFEDFLQTGGIPEYVLHGDIEYLKELVDDIISKDIATFYGIKNIQLLRDFFLLLMERAGKAVSINKLARILDISPDTAKRFIDMFAETYLIHLVARHGKTNVKLLSPKKIYAADLGIRNLFTGFRDKGSLFENYVYLKIAGKKPFYVYEGGNEIDFFTEDKTLIEVKYGSSLTPKQHKLLAGFKAKKRLIIRGFKDLNLLN